MNIETTLKQIIMQHLGVTENQVTPNARFADDLGADSLDAMDLLVAVNDEFNIHIPPEAMDSIVTVEDLSAAIAEALSSAD